MLFFVFQDWLSKVLLLFLCFLNLFSSKMKVTSTGIQRLIVFYVFPLPASLRVDRLINVVFCFSRLIVEGFVVVFMFP